MYIPANYKFSTQKTRHQQVAKTNLGAKHNMPHQEVKAPKAEEPAIVVKKTYLEKGDQPAAPEMI